MKLLEGRARVLPALAFLLLIGCVPSQHSISDSNGTTEIAEIRRLQADQMTLIAAIRTELREINGRIDELAYKQESLKGLSDQISGVSRRLPPPQGVPLAELESSERFADSQNDESLAQALASLRGGKFRNSIESLDKAISSNGTNAQYLYWLGVSHELYGTLEKALGAFHECASSFSKDSLAPASLSRQAEVFIKLSDKNSAKLTLQKLIATYPTSTYAQNAKGRLKNL